MKAEKKTQAGKDGSEHANPQQVNSQVEALWFGLSQKLKQFILSRVGDEMVADDLLQEVFIKVHTHIDSLNDRTKIQSWMYQITRNLISDYFRSQHKGLNTENTLPDEDEVDASEFMSEALQDMAKMMSALPEAYCEALCLTELQGMSQKMYAEKTGISYSGAKSRVQRARVMLRDMLMNCCHYQFDHYGSIIDIRPVRCCCCNSHT